MARSTAVATAEQPAPLPALLADYAIATLDGGDLAEVIRENVGGGGIGRFDLDRVKIPAGGGTTWEVPTLEGAEPFKELAGVVVQFADQRAFWRARYGSGGGDAPPDCSSADLVMGVGDPGVPCDECPFSKFGTAVRQDGSEGRGQACRLVRVLYMVLPHSILPVVVAVPPGSLKTVRKYFLRLASQGIPYHGVVTRLRLRSARSVDGVEYSEVEPLFGGRLAPEDKARIAPLKAMLQAQVKTVDARDFRAAEEPPF